MPTIIITACIYFIFFSFSFVFGPKNNSNSFRRVEQYQKRNLIVEEDGNGGGGSGTPVCDAAKNILYVDTARPNNNGDGYSWATAKKTLQAATYIANRCTNINRINVAEGVYKASNTSTPTAATRDKSFFIGDNYSIYGGYPNGGSTTRDYINNPTILDGETIDLYEAYHTVVIYGITGTVTIDGFQIKRGFADGAGSVELDPGITMGRDDGAGIYIKDAANVIIRNCAIYSNVASGNGGGIFNSNSTLTLVNTVLANNTAVYGGGLQNQTGSVATITNCTFGGNIGVTAAGVAYSTTGTIINVTNTIAWGNVNVWGGGGTRNISYSLIQDGNVNTYGLNVDPGFNNPANLDGGDNKWFTSDDGLAIPFCSPAVNRGDNDALPSTTTDIKGESRKYNVQIDMGAYENQSIPYPLSPAQRSIHGDESENYLWGGVTAFTVPGCRIIGSITPQGVHPMQGFTRAKTFIETEDLSYLLLPLVNRHYEFESSSIISPTTGRITLFFSNGEFANYNTRPNAVAVMPTTDGINKQHLRILQFHGISNSGMPGSYGSNNITLIDPNDADIIWSQGTLTWRISFDVVGESSGFFLAAVSQYRFIGTGNWNDATKWEGGKIPPTVLPGFCEIIIANGSNCILNIEQKISKYGKLTVEPTAGFTIQGDLLINPPNPI